MLLYCLLLLLTVSISYLFALEGVQKRKLRDKKLTLNNAVMLSFLIIFLFMGFRYNVGRDFIQYTYHFFYVDTSLFGTGRRYQSEYGYLMMLELSKMMDIGPQALFVVTSFFTVALLYNLYRTSPKYLPLGIVCFFFCGPYVFFINGIRQGLAILSFLNAVPYLWKRLPWEKSVFFYCLWIFVGTMFHSSCWIVIVMLPLRFVNLNAKSLQYLFFLLPLIAYLVNISGLFSNYLNMTDFLVTDSWYDGYLEKDNIFEISGNARNFGQTLTFITSLIPLFYFKESKDIEGIRVLLSLYSIGLFFYFLFNGNQMMIRVSYYFYYVLLLLYPLYFRGVLKKRNSINIFFFVIFVSWLVVAFVYSLPKFFEEQLHPNASIFGIGIN